MERWCAKSTPIPTGMKCPVCNKPLAIGDVLNAGYMQRAKTRPDLLEACDELLVWAEEVLASAPDDVVRAYEEKVITRAKAAIEEAERK